MVIYFWTVPYAKIKDKMPQKLKRNGQTVRTLIQLLRALLAKEPDKCEHCGGTDFDTQIIQTDRTYLDRHILHQGRSPPTVQVSTTGSSIMASS